MGFWGWIIFGLVVAVLLFVISSTETQDKIINGSPSFLKPVLEALQSEKTDTIKINNADYDKLGMIKEKIEVDKKCETDDQCNKFFNDCLNRGGCKCKEGNCYIQKLP